ncbi:MAG: ATP-binding protein [Nitrospinota bacterium]|nr:ATP-binding protein [Nitrospinota bacterium]
MELFKKFNLSGKIIAVSIMASLAVLSIGFSVIVDREEMNMMMMVKEHSEIISASIRENVRNNYSNIESNLDYLQSYAESLSERKDVIHLELLDHDAIVIAHTDRKMIGEVATQEHMSYVKKVLKNGNIVEHADKKEGTFTIFAPVSHAGKNQENRIVGVIELVMRLHDDIPAIRKTVREIISIANINMARLFFDMEAGVENLQNTSESLALVKDVIHLELIDKNLNIIAHTQADRVGKKPLKRHLLSIEKVFETGIEQTDMDTKLQQYTRFIPIAKNKEDEIAIVAELVMDMRHALHGISEMRLSMITTAGIMALIIIITLTLFLGRIVILPVHRLTNAAESVSEGNLDVNVKVDSQDELGILAESFNRMTLDLKVYREKLESAKDSAEEANRLKSLFIANVNHEIGSPLQSILGLSQLIKEGMCNDKEEEMKFINDIVVSAFHLQGLMKGLLSLSIIETGKRPANINIYRIGEILDRVRQITWMQAKEKNLELIIKYEDSEKNPAVYCDSIHLQEALVNFVSNAIKFTDKGSITIRIECLRHEGKMHIDITDTGIGIEEKYLNDIFEPFMQASGEKKRGGAGLGLSIAKELVTGMGGSVSVHSDGLGKGTTFRIVLSLPEE